MSTRHPSADIVASLGTELEGKRIVLCMSGSVAAVKSSDLARLLMRHGAEVYPVMSRAATRIIHPDLMEWATGHKPVTSLSGKIEHVALAGNVTDRADLVIVAPATANTIGKIACGIDDTPVTTVVTTAIGEGIPLIIVPAMHESMYRHPFVKENIEKLRSHGIRVIEPRIEESKAKIAQASDIYDEVLRVIGPDHILEGVRILITAGRTVEYIDPIRVITNNSSGKMGVALATAAVRLGAEVTLIYGRGTAVPPLSVKLVRVETSDSMFEAVKNELSEKQYDVFIGAAAVGDWKPREKAETKISTHLQERLSIELVATPKIIDTVKDIAPDIFLVAFRAITAPDEASLIAEARERLISARADLIAVNDVGKPGRGFESDTNELFVIDRQTTEHIKLSTKEEVGLNLLRIISSRMHGRKHPVKEE
ncbi:MAG TPA: bifunctional phosphopantothenoylcysteine decarboxylase/phosphopantothenate--cysteine ligase CoaBC [Spirochaetia bacterium]|nr:bifunctional phosphopantothenoylcysteine decarboxylase/phosphopantothenate--cysteine ligase CoaBC [Spirochaetia bacterium]